MLQGSVGAFGLCDCFGKIGAKVEIMEAVVIRQYHFIFNGFVKSGKEIFGCKVEDVSAVLFVG